MNMTDKRLDDETEWEAQERGRRAARGREAGGMDAADADYRIVAQALASAPLAGPPADFAAGVAERVARHDAGIERAMSRILLAVFAIALLGVGVRYGAQGWQPLRYALGEVSLGWLLAGAGCVILSWTGRRLFELAGHARGPGRVA
ncbi:hypothetical protein JR065_17660 [Xanthomonas sp. AmX2]|uniref:hypothetical protein n=1 Tax=Xanthomonas sp. TaxID=29446 RepID=UPI0019822741|nr:hypothetical protein [Xanthomonas sp.]MBN6152173.1 hypothetical protein [Xanthomonas sp.]